MEIENIGNTHGDTRLFDDMDILGDAKLLRLAGFECHSGKFVNGLQFIYEVLALKVAEEGGVRWIKGHAALGDHGHYTKHTTIFQPGEYITTIGGKHGSIMDSLVITTNKKRYAFGGPGGGPFTRNLPIGCVPVLSGGFGGHIHCIGLTLVKMEWTPKTHALFPSNFRRTVKALLMLHRTNTKGEPIHPDSLFSLLPVELLHYVFSLLAEAEVTADIQTNSNSKAVSHNTQIGSKINSNNNNRNNNNSTTTDTNRKILRRKKK